MLQACSPDVEFRREVHPFDLATRFGDGGNNGVSPRPVPPVIDSSARTIPYVHSPMGDHGFSFRYTSAERPAAARVFAATRA